MFTIHFIVDVPFSIHENESVFVTGNNELLGNWEPNGAIKLSKETEGRWTATITILNVDTVKFRYFIGYYLESEPQKTPTLIVSKWETHLICRNVMPAVEASKTRVCRANVYDIFGFHGGKECISNGWIVNDSQNQIILTVTGEALKFFKPKHIQQKYRIKIVSLDLRNKEETPYLDVDNEESLMDSDDLTYISALPSYSQTEIAEITIENGDPFFRDQNQCGEVFQNNVNYLVYRTQSVAVDYLSFRIEVYSTEKDELVAMGYALPSTLHDTIGKASVPLLTKKGLPVGKIYFRYLFVRPLKLPHPPQKMVAAYTRHWKKRTTLEVGHRGMGKSYTMCAVARENTLHSLNSAAKNGADLVEFDVHLTKDKVPIVYHDFHVMVSVAKRSPSVASIDSLSSKDPCGDRKTDMYQLAVKDLKLSQLRLLHLDHVEHSDEGGKHINTHKVTGAHDEEEEHLPFPTLAEAFKNVSEEVGFNVELKYPMLQVDGIYECENYFERNEFLDIILADVLTNASNRRIVFSSFDPDICTMITLKQNKYPVLFLCTGNSLKHVAFVDERTQTSMMAVKFVAGMGLMGVNFNSEDLLKDPAPVAKAREYGLISFVWGDELIDKKIVDYFKKTLLVDGVIYDGIGERETRSNLFSLEKKMKAALFARKEPKPVTPPRSNSTSHLVAFQQQPIQPTPPVSKCDMVVDSSSGSSSFSIDVVEPHNNGEKKLRKAKSFKRHNSSLNSPASGYFSTSHPHPTIKNGMFVASEI